MNASFNQCTEANILAIIDSSTSFKEPRDVEDDRLAFLDAVRGASLVPEYGFMPTSKMFRAIFFILKDATSLQLLMESFQLLNELDKHFPRIYASKSSSNGSYELVVKEVWSPFSLGSETSCTNKEATYRSSDNPLDPNGFFLLTQNIGQVIGDQKLEISKLKPLSDMLLFQYLVNVLEKDFLHRNTVFKDTMNWDTLKDSFLNLLLGSKRTNFKGLTKEFLAIISSELEERKSLSENIAHKCDLKDIEKRTFMSMHKLLTLIMELDLTKKQANVTGRSYGLRTPIIEMILDEFTYNKDRLSPFLEVFSDPKWKLEIVLQYFWKYVTKPSVRTRSCNSSSEDANFYDILRLFTNERSTKSVVRNLGSELAQVLLAHGFQAYMFIRHNVTGNTTTLGGVEYSSVLEICKSITSAFQSLKRIDKGKEMLPFVRRAFFTAATIVSAKS